MYPSLSIVTPSYQQARYLDDTLRSVLDQSYPHLEYVVIDGGSTDDSIEIIERYAKVSRLSDWVSEPDRGQADAINKGFARTNGTIMGWLNSDDVYLPGALTLVGEIFARYPQIAWLSGLNMTIDATGQPRPLTPTPGKYRGLIAHGVYHGRLVGFIRQESTFWRRTLWEQVGGSLDIQRHYSMDFDLWQRFARCADLVTIQAPLAAFRQHSEQKTAQIAAYYNEIDVRLPNWTRWLAFPLRLAVSTIPLYPRVVFDTATQAWTFRPGAFFRPGVTDYDEVT